MTWTAVKKTKTPSSENENDVATNEITHSLSEKITKFTPTLHSLISAFLKIFLVGFIVYLTWQWFSFMRDTVNFYLYHFNVFEKNPPESVIIATITLGATITGLMVIILKGLFGGKES